MKLSLNKKIIILILISLCLNFSIFSETSASASSTTDEENELPQGLLDFRRFEIITLGAMPFITLDVTLGYSTYQYFDTGFTDGFENATFPNPFKSSEEYSLDEMKNIIISSLGICIGIGASDLIFNLIKRNKLKLQNQKKQIEISTIENDSDAIKIQLPDNQKEQDDDVEFIEEE